MKKLSEKVSYVAITIIMGAIIVSFALTGFHGGFGPVSSSSVASVDGNEISISEYQNAYNSQLAQFESMLGGKKLTQAQLRMFNIKQRVIQGLVQQKMFLNFATDLGLDADKDLIKKEISIYPNFQTNGQFDVAKYRAILSNPQVGISATEFEEDMKNQAIANKLNALLMAQMSSKASAKSRLSFESMAANTIAISYDTNELSNQLVVPKAKITTFVSDEKNQSLLQSLYETYKTSSEDKNKKSFDQVKNRLAKEHIQKTMFDEQQKLVATVKEQIETNLKSKNIKALKKLAKKYKLEMNTTHEVTLTNAVFNSVKFDDAKVTSLFKKEKDLIEASSSTKYAYIVPVKFFDKDLSKGPKGEKLQPEVAMRQADSSIAQQAIIKYKQDKSNVVISNNLL